MPYFKITLKDNRKDQSLAACKLPYVKKQKFADILSWIGNKLSNLELKIIHNS